MDTAPDTREMACTECGELFILSANFRADEELLAEAMKSRQTFTELVRSITDDEEVLAEREVSPEEAEEIKQRAQTILGNDA